MVSVSLVRGQVGGIASDTVQLPQEETRTQERDRSADRQHAEDGNANDGGVAAAASRRRKMNGTKEEEDEDEDEDEAGEEEEEEAYDIDDLSSENQTSSSSPVSHPHDPKAHSIPSLVSHPSTSSSMSTASVPFADRTSFPFGPAPTSSGASSVADLQDSLADRFGQAFPKPPRLSSRHSHSEGRGRTPVSAPPNFSSHRIAGNMSTGRSRRRERGEEGDRDHLRDASADRAFAVLGADSDTSAVSGTFWVGSLDLRILPLTPDSFSSPVFQSDQEGGES